MSGVYSFVFLLENVQVLLESDIILWPFLYRRAELDMRLTKPEGSLCTKQPL